MLNRRGFLAAIFASPLLGFVKADKCGCGERQMCKRCLSDPKNYSTANVGDVSVSTYSNGAPILKLTSSNMTYSDYTTILYSNPADCMSNCIQVMGTSAFNFKVEKLT